VVVNNEGCIFNFLICGILGILEVIKVNNQLWVSLSNGKIEILSLSLRVIQSLPVHQPKVRTYVLVDAYPFLNEVIAVNEKGSMSRFNRVSGELLSVINTQHQSLVKCGIAVGSTLWTADVLGCILIWNLSQQVFVFLYFSFDF
jgi:hypothetical protein